MWWVRYSKFGFWKYVMGWKTRIFFIFLPYLMIFNVEHVSKNHQTCRKFGRKWRKKPCSKLPQTHFLADCGYPKIWFSGTYIPDQRSSFFFRIRLSTYVLYTSTAAPIVIWVCIELLQSFRRHATHCSHTCAIFTRKLANSSPAAAKAGSTYLTYYNFFLR